MSLFCCTRSEHEASASGSRVNITSEDYLLPGGEWDPSVSSSPGHKAGRGNRRGITRSASGRKKKKSSLREFWTRRFHGSHAASEEFVSGEYQAPVAPASRSLPTLQEFRMLKTVGRGAFGKVGVSPCSFTNGSKRHKLKHENFNQEINISSYGYTAALP